MDGPRLTLEGLYGPARLRPQRLGRTCWLAGGGLAVIEPSTSVAEASDVVAYTPDGAGRRLLVSAAELVTCPGGVPVRAEACSQSSDARCLLLFANSQRVWRFRTRGDYLIFNLESRRLTPVGQGLPRGSLMHAKLSPDGERVAYVSGANLYVECLSSGEVVPLTADGGGDILNGTFDWAYEEGFGCLDGFRWSPKGSRIAFWRLDTSNIGMVHFLAGSNEPRPRVVSLRYPRAGQKPAGCRIGVIEIPAGIIRWLEIPGDPSSYYLPRAQWIDDAVLLVHQLDRRQGQLDIWHCDLSADTSESVYSEHDEAWVDIVHYDASGSRWDAQDLMLLDGGRSFLRLTDRNGWRHVYRITPGGAAPALLTPVEYDVARLHGVDAEERYLYFSASPENPVQRYLFRVPLNSSAPPERITPATFAGLNIYDIAPGGALALHTHSSANDPPTVRLIRLPGHTEAAALVRNQPYRLAVRAWRLPEVEFFKLMTDDGVEMDGRMTKPADFDPAMVYPVCFNVYGAPWTQLALDAWGEMWHFFLAQLGYVSVAVDPRGTACLKGRKWRKSIHRKLGTLNTHDQATAVSRILQWDFIDRSRSGVWGWSEGGTMALNLMFRYPDVFQTGMAIAPIVDPRLHYSLYQERYRGAAADHETEYIESSPLSCAEGLKANLLIVHGTADDHVHYQHTERLVNRLVQLGKLFQVMPYPDCAHGLTEGERTRLHLYALLTDFLVKHMPPGAAPRSHRRPR